MAEIEMELEAQPDQPPSGVDVLCEGRHGRAVGENHRWPRVVQRAIMPKELGFKNVDMKKKVLSELVFEIHLHRMAGARGDGAVPRPSQGVRLQQRHARWCVEVGDVEDLEIPITKQQLLSMRPASGWSASSAPTRPVTSPTANATIRSSTHLDPRQLRYRIRRDGQGDARVQERLQPGVHDVRLRVAR